MPALAPALMAASSVMGPDMPSAPSDPDAWLTRVEAKGMGEAGDDRLTREERAEEFLLMGYGWRKASIHGAMPSWAGRSLYPPCIALLREEGVITVDASGRLRVTASGFPLLDAVVADLAA